MRALPLLAGLNEVLLSLSRPHGIYETIPMDEKEEAFPRGGKQLLTPLEKVIIEAQAKQDLLFDEVRDVWK